MAGARGRYSLTFSNLERLMAMIITSSKKELLSRSGIGAVMSERMLQVRAAAKEMGRPLRMSDVISMSGIGKKAMFTGDRSAGDVAKHIASYEGMFSRTSNLHDFVREPGHKSLTKS